LATEAVVGAAAACGGVAAAAAVFLSGALVGGAATLCVVLGAEGAAVRTGAARSCASSLSSSSSLSDALRNWFGFHRPAFLEMDALRFARSSSSLCLVPPAKLRPFCSPRISAPRSAGDGERDGEVDEPPASSSTISGAIVPARASPGGTSPRVFPGKAPRGERCTPPPGLPPLPAVVATLLRKLTEFAGVPVGEWGC
jgi:hypothetical protein